MNLRRFFVGGLPSEFAVRDNSSKIYFNIEDTAEIGVLDVARDTLVARWALPGCEQPSGLALDRGHARLFSVCRNDVMTATDAHTGRQVARLSISTHADAVLYDAARATLLASNGSGTLSVIRQDGADSYGPSVTVTIGTGARTMAIERSTG